jgi:hypothetical protein
MTKGDIFVAIFEPPHKDRNGKLDDLEGKLHPWQCFNELVGPFKDEQAAMDWIDWFEKPGTKGWFHFSITPASSPEAIFNAVEE